MPKLGPLTTAGITTGDLARQLQDFPPGTELAMGGLRFYRLKRRGPNLVQLEFDEVVYRDKDGTLHATDVNSEPE